MPLDLVYILFYIMRFFIIKIYIYIYIYIHVSYMACNGNSGLMRSFLIDTAVMMVCEINNK